MRPALLLSILAWLFCLNAAAQDLAAQPYLGGWVNRNENTRSITHAEIKLEKGGIAVQMWGKCHPHDCDWGMVTATVNDPDAEGPSLQVIWEQGFCARIQTLRLNNEGMLTVETHTHYTDKSGRKDSVLTEYFIRQPDAAKKPAVQP